MIRTIRVVLDRDLAEIYGVAGASRTRFPLDPRQPTWEYRRVGHFHV